MEEFIFGTFKYRYHLIKEDRKTLSLTVTPDLQIILKCPFGLNIERQDKFLKRKWFWLEKQLNFFKKYRRKKYEKEYVSGESFRYLGRQYKLIVKPSKENKAILSKGQIVIFTNKLVSDSKNNKKILDQWVLEKTEKIFLERLGEVFKLFNYDKIPKVEVRDMKKRWGSFLNQKKIFLNPKLIHVSKECIDYVLIHELCHFKFRSHDKRFFNLLKEKCPNWKKIKEKLEISLVE